MSEGTHPEAQTEKPKAKQNYSLVNEYSPQKGLTRREFFADISKIAWLSFTGASVVGLSTCGRFLIRNVLFEPPSVFKAGKLEDYEWDKPDERFKQTYGVWLIKLSQDVDELGGKPTFAALSTVCTHLGCTPNVLLAEKKIKCPCHGSGFTLAGVNFEGPAPRPLERYKVQLDPSTKEIVVDKNKKFQWEKGEWTNPDSYLDLTRV